MNGGVTLKGMHGGVEMQIEEGYRGTQSKAGRFGQAWNTGAQMVADSFEARQAGEKLKDKKGARAILWR